MSANNVSPEDARWDMLQACILVILQRIGNSIQAKGGRDATRLLYEACGFPETTECITLASSMEDRKEFGGHKAAAVLKNSVSIEEFVDLIIDLYEMEVITIEKDSSDKATEIRRVR